MDWNLIRKLIETGKEEDYVDFKQEVDSYKEIAKDIICMSNIPGGKDGYLIIGVNDNGEVIGLHDEVKFNNVQDTLNNMQFFGDQMPSIDVESEMIDGKLISVVHVKHTFVGPICVTKKYNRDKGYSGMEQYLVYTRNGSVNSPASYPIVEQLWKEKFTGLSPEEKLKRYLADYLNWTKVESDETRFIYNADDDWYITIRYVTEENTALCVGIGAVSLPTFAITVMAKGISRAEYFAYDLSDRWVIEPRMNGKASGVQFMYTLEGSEMVLLEKVMNKSDQGPVAPIMVFKDFDEIMRFKDFIAPHESVVSPETLLDERINRLVREGSFQEDIKGRITEADTYDANYLPRVHAGYAWRCWYVYVSGIWKDNRE